MESLQLILSLALLALASPSVSCPCNTNPAIQSESNNNSDALSTFLSGIFATNRLVVSVSMGTVRLVFLCCSNLGNSKLEIKEITMLIIFQMDTPNN